MIHAPYKTIWSSATLPAQAQLPTLVENFKRQFDVGNDNVHALTSMIRSSHPPSLLPPPCSHPCPHRSSSGARAHLDAAQRRRAPREGERPGGAPPLALRAGRDGRRRRRRGVVPRQAQGLCGAAEGRAAAAKGVHGAGTRPSFPPQCHPFTPAAPCRPHSHPQRTHPIPLWTPRPFTPHPLGPPRRRSSRCRTASRRARSPRSRRRRGSRSRRSTSTSPTSRSSATRRSATTRSTCSSGCSRRPTRR